LCIIFECLRGILRPLNSKSCNRVNGHVCQRALFIHLTAFIYFFYKELNSFISLVFRLKVISELCSMAQIYRFVFSSSHLSLEAGDKKDEGATLDLEDRARKLGHANRNHHRIIHICFIIRSELRYIARY